MNANASFGFIGVVAVFGFFLAGPLGGREQAKLSVVEARVTAGEQRSVAGVALCWCPAGSFRMGSSPSEPGHRPDEKQVDVTLSQGFWVGKYEVTQGEWARMMETFPGERNAGRGDRYPVYWVNYSEAEEFCRRLTAAARNTGELSEEWEFRLPTEAQWEYACRAGTSSAYSFGATLSLSQANFGRPFRGAPAGYPDGSSEPVGSYPPNAWGVHDMHGNEFEWCRDWYREQLPGGRDPEIASMSGTPNRDGSFSRVRRGGAWTDEPVFCRSALRLRFEPERRSDHIGFRVALVRRDARRD